MAEATVAYLREREQATAVYLERRVNVQLEDGRRVRALTFVADHRHPQYAGRLPHEDLIRLVKQGIGISGANPDYVHSTHRELIEIGASDRILARIAEQLAQEGEDSPASSRKSATIARRSSSDSAKR